jgi:predicted type IV restriction endonuclease
MKEIIEDIRKKLKDGSYKNEQHIRISLVTQICQALGWNIWDPVEFDTEFKVDKLVSDAKDSSGKGSVDVALVKDARRKNVKLFALIETKYLGEIDQASRKQLEEYSLKLNHPLSILTDGIIWEFYLNCLDSPNGNYTDRRFNIIDIKQDNIDDICLLFESILNKKVTPAALTTLGKKMKKEFFVIQCIKQVRPQVESQYPNDVPRQIHEAYNMIVQLHGKAAVQPVQITGLWNTKITLGGLQKIPGDPAQGLGFSPGAITKPLKSYTGKTIKEVSLNGGNAIAVANIAQMKKAVYDFIVSKDRSFSPKQSSGLRIQDNRDGFRVPTQLKDGRYIEGSLSFDSAVDQCKRALKLAGYTERDLIIGYK